MARERTSPRKLCAEPRLLLLLLLGALPQPGCSSTAAKSDGATELGTVCDPSSCSGCCQGSVCQPGDTTEACGTSALPCVVCQQKETCTQGQCIAEGAKCTPLTCASGCCQDDLCQTGMAKEACGKGGARCMACSSTQKCDNHACVCAPGACTGCCELGVCRSGTTAAACGSGGQPCKKCGSTQGCVAGLCKSGSSCSDSNCTGCCEGTICKGGTSKETCGLNGRTCQICGATESCVLGICNDAQSCGPSSCASGCCQSSKCMLGTTSAACGKGGGLCTSCIYPKICQSGGCVLDPASQWGITVVSAEINTSKTWDWPFYTAPDPFVVIEVAGQKGNTSTKNDTYKPVWDEYLFSVTAGTLITNNLLVSVWDDDLTPDQLIGQCSVSVGEAVVLNGTGIVPGCGADVLKIELRFTLK